MEFFIINISPTSQSVGQEPSYQARAHPTIDSNSGGGESSSSSSSISALSTISSSKITILNQPNIRLQLSSIPTERTRELEERKQSIIAK